MAQKITNLEKILDPWMAQEPDSDRRVAVIEGLAWIGENLGLVESWPAIHGHPLKRVIDVPAAEVRLTVLLTRPFVGAHLLAINPL